VQAERVQDALTHCRVENSRHTALAQIVIAVERLEDESYTADEIRGFVEQVLAAPAQADARADTRGT
jgi:predicted protein tyrosine phosphatase